MIFTETTLSGAYVIEPQRHEDERGFFARVFCEHEFADHGLCTQWVQCNISFNHKMHTLRGMHYQIAPDEEIKVVRCTRGKLYDVIIDLRDGSPTLGHSFGVELSAENCTMLYIPAGFAHGFITLEDQTEAFYQMSAFFAPGSARGVRWNDPVFDIQWPAEPQVICERDAAYPDWNIDETEGK